MVADRDVGGDRAPVEHHHAVAEGDVGSDGGAGVHHGGERAPGGAQASDQLAPDRGGADAERHGAGVCLQVVQAPEQLDAERDQPLGVGGVVVHDPGQRGTGGAPVPPARAAACCRVTMISRPWPPAPTTTRSMGAGALMTGPSG